MGPTPVASGDVTDQLATQDLIESRVGVHDSNHFEVRLDYLLDSTRNHSRYQVECYLFVPRSLGINRFSYRREQFYSNIQGYIRFKAPVIGFRTLADAADPVSPLGVVDAVIEQLRLDPRNFELRRRLSHELRMFACIARAQLRERVALLRRALAGRHTRSGVAGPTPAGPTPAAADIRLLVHRLLGDLTVLLGAWRQRRVEFLGQGRSHGRAGVELPAIVCDIYAFTDEYLSHVVEHELTNLVGDLTDRDELADVRAELVAELLAERSHRQRCGYDGADTGDPEQFVFRRGMLKKLVTSVLWLEIAKEKDGKGIVNLAAAIAAGAAMAFALIAALLGNRMGYVADTWGFVAAGTLIYMFKDRLKDWLRGAMTAQTGRWLADYTTEIRDPVSGRVIGRCRESFGYYEPSSVPREVLALRHAKTPTALDADAKPEIVIKYTKGVRLRSKSLAEQLHLSSSSGGPLGGSPARPAGDYEVNDIMRICMNEFLIRADDPITKLPVYDPERDVVTRREFHKTYHLNLVMVMRGADCAPVLRHIRVVFDKHGIRRVT